MAVVGTAEVAGTGTLIYTAFDPEDKHYDPKSDPDSPTWFMVDVKFLQKFDTPVTRDDLKAGKVTSGMMVMQRGSRLSIQPVSEAEWKSVQLGRRERAEATNEAVSLQCVCLRRPESSFAGE